MSITDELKENAKELTVLYVEDEDDIRSQVSQILGLFFGTMHVGVNGLNGLELYKENEVDLVVTDLTMPKMNGIDMIKNIKEIDSLQHVIVLTAHNSSDNLIETMDLQIDGFLLKPMKMDKMLSLLTKVTNTINLEKKEEKK